MSSKGVENGLKSIIDGSKLKLNNDFTSYIVKHVKQYMISQLTQEN